MDNMSALYRTAEACYRKADRDSEATIYDKAVYLVDVLEPSIRSAVVDDVFNAFQAVLTNLEADATEAETRADEAAIREAIELVRATSDVVVQKIR